MSGFQASDLTHLMAALNAATVVMLLLGFALIVQKRRRAHRACMLTALGLGAVFLVVYTVHQVHKFGAEDRLGAFSGQGIVEIVFFVILIAHVVAAIAIAILVPWTLFRAFGSKFDAHRKIARLALPAWVFVCASGLAVYVLVEHPPAGATLTATQEVSCSIGPETGTVVEVTDLSHCRAAGQDRTSPADPAARVRPAQL